MFFPLVFLAAAAGEPGQATQPPYEPPSHAAMVVTSPAPAAPSAAWKFPVPPVPALREETIPPPQASSEQQIWHPGFWNWSAISKAYDWTPGFWMKRPDTIGKDNLWLPGHWQQSRPGSVAVVWIAGQWL
jgi:hypothetical protein